jgi:tetratricopeptide (TPR) repeat protein
MPRVERRTAGTLLAAACLAACASKAPGARDDAPTLASLSSRTVAVEKDRRAHSDEAQALAAYRAFLAAAPKTPQTPGRAEAMRRLGDLEMDLAEQQNTPDYQAAIGRYREFLATYPSDPGNHRVLYQLARAQELGGALEAALKTLDELVIAYPATPLRDEAMFRRGELLFTLRQYGSAEAAYDAVLASTHATPLRDRALYMHGWSRFKQGRLEEGLASFFGVLDAKLAGDSDTLSRGDRELVDDTLRVMSLSLTSLQGAESIAPHINHDTRRRYEFHVHEHLAELYLKQDRPKDAADALASFARRQPLHAQAPVMLSRVIDIHEGAGFASLALDAKQAYVQHYGAAGEFRRANPAGYERARPLVRKHLAELARHWHASAQKSKASADVAQAVRWYRDIVAGFPGEAETARAHFLLAELLMDDGQHAQAALANEQVAYGYAPHERSADAGYAALLAHAEIDKRAAADHKAAAQRAGVASALRFADAFAQDARVAAVLTHAAERLYALKDTVAAQQVAERVLALEPPATQAQRRVATVVLAHTAFEAGAFDRAEQRYAQVLALTPPHDAARADLVERQAAAIYRQGEATRARRWRTSSGWPPRRRSRPCMPARSTTRPPRWSS